MKKYYLLPLSCLLLWGCSANDPASGSPEEEVATTNKYLSINVVPSKGIGSRAPGEAGSDNYQDGTSAENSVTQVRFFFFNDEGEATPVWRNKGTGTGAYTSYIDWYPSTEDNGSDNTETVEKIISTTLDLVLPENLVNNHPTGVVAVLNPSADVLALNPSSSIDVGETKLTVNGPSLTELQSTTADFRTDLMTAGKFVMSNSVYMNNSSEIITATRITEDNYAETPEEAEEMTPVTIYVERVLSRLDFVMNLTNDYLEITPSDGSPKYYIYKVGSYNIYDESLDEVTSEMPVYIRLLGWNITGTPNVSNLVKEISANWQQNKLFGNDDPWNTADYHRSFWAMNPNPTTSGFDYLFGNFNGSEVVSGLPAPTFSAATSLAIPGPDSYTTTYMQENANAFTNSLTNAELAPEYSTKVIIAAQLVDAQGKPISLAEWAHFRYTLDMLKAKLCSSALNNLYKKTTTDTQTSYTGINVNDITFATGEQLGIDEEDEASYYVYPVLTTQAEGYVWTLGNDENSTEMTSAQVNAYIRDAVNHVKVWSEGYTYYFFDIEHLGEIETPGFAGVVRNHLYQTNLQSIAGLGTPVYEPSQTIYPEKTENDASIVIADIRILQWRLIRQDYNLEWE